MAPVLLKALMTVVIPTAIICFLVYEGGFDKASTEIGLKHYAERASPFLRKMIPKWLKMPLNTFVNFGYVIVGAYWLAVTSNQYSDNIINETDAYVFYVFNIMGCFYGPIQMLRIVTEKHRYAILDQWVTLPFFMWVFIWSSYLSHGWSNGRAFIGIVLSISSYILTQYWTVGFEISLALHITIAIAGAVMVFKLYRTSEAYRPFMCAIFSCCGFVGLKLLDLHLPTIHLIFTKISGHFLSKIADVLQIHYVNQYFIMLTLRKNQLQNDKVK